MSTTKTSAQIGLALFFVSLLVPTLFSIGKTTTNTFTAWGWLSLFFVLLVPAGFGYLIGRGDRNG